MLSEGAPTVALGGNLDETRRHGCRARNEELGKNLQGGDDVPDEQDGGHRDYSEEPRVTVETQCWSFPFSLFQNATGNLVFPRVYVNTKSLLSVFGKKFGFLFDIMLYIPLTIS